MPIKYYTGIGSRNIPSNYLEHLCQLATDLQDLGYTLRSGAADGCDLAFESGVDTTKPNCMDIYLPWIGFNNKSSVNHHVVIDPVIVFQAELLARSNHPAWSYLSQRVKRLMTRNVFQILGTELNTPSDFVVCWTNDGCDNDKDRTKETGGTGLAISIASKLHIPVINLNSHKYLGNIQDKCDAIVLTAETLDKNRNHRTVGQYEN